MSWWLIELWLEHPAWKPALSSAVTPEWSEDLDRASGGPVCGILGEVAGRGHNGSLD